jgi:serine/threonine-protein kinase RsbW
LRSAEIAQDGLRLVLNNTLAAVEDGRQAMLRYLGPLDSKVQNRLEVLFEELVANIVRHGFAPGSAQSIHVRVEKHPSKIQLTLEDDGAPFNPLEAEVPEPFHDIETARVGGLGIPLVVKLASAVRYERPEPAGGAFRAHNRIIVSVAA